LRDNYAYLVVCEKTNQAAVVDPSEVGPVVAAVEAEGVELKAIWNTHHHFDHTGGNKELLDRYPELPVVAHGSDRGRVPGQSTFAEAGDTVTLGEEVSARIIHNPGHTLGAISYYIENPGVVFTGDTLFAGGCGRIFEGTPAQMLDSLTRLAELPGETLVYCGHEYTEANLRFARAAEPGNSAIAERAEQVAAVRAEGRPSVPSSMSEEVATNPFLRASSAELAKTVAKEEPPADDSEVEVFAAVRRWKDRF
jgi:hydroxyacylglutathione hydrolase